MILFYAHPNLDTRQVSIRYLLWDVYNVLSGPFLINERQVDGSI